MVVKVLSEDGTQRKLSVEVSADEMKPYFDEATEMIREEAQVEGFRKGKVPRDVIRRRFNEQIKADALPVIIEEFYKQAIDETNTDAIAIGQIEKLDFKPEQPLSFEVTVEIMPAYEVANYKGLQVRKEVHKITDDEVTATLEKLRDNYSTFKEAPEILPGFVCTFDIQMTDEGGVPLIGKKYTDRRFALSPQFVGQDFIEQMTGATVGSTRLLHVAKGPDAKEGELEHMSVTVRKIEEVQRPELDDEFAKDVGLETFEKLRADVLDNLKHQWQHEEENQLNEALIDEIIKQNDLPVPEPLVDNALQRLAAMIRQRLKNQKIDDAYINERYRPMAIRDVKWMLAKKKILELESLKVEETDIEEYREHMAKHHKVEKDTININFKTNTEQKQFDDHLLDQKLMKLLRTHAVIEEVEAPAEVIQEPETV
ncbi:MAG: trigger factor [Bacteroidetes bacterium]|nr:trigger factor [Bacteroidota bacterium]